MANWPLSLIYGRNREEDKVKNKMDARMVRVKIELDLIEGKHFPEESSAISEQDLIASATESFIAWLDSWCGEPNNNSLREYIQAKVIYK